MYTLLAPLQKLLIIKKIQIYNNVFKLHTKLTVILLLIFSLLISTKQYFGNPITCIVSNPDIKEVVETFCWIAGTYINEENYDGQIGTDIIDIGVGIFTGDSSKKNYQKYYQWVAFILVIQAVVFYVPAYLWKIWEGGRIGMLCEGLNKPILDEDINDKRWEKILGYLTSKKTNVNTLYAIRFFFCEFINLVIVVLNISFINIMFTGFWTNYTPAVKTFLSMDWKLWNSHSSRMFPKVTKCDFFKYGASGSIQFMDSLCILPLNVVNEKIYAFLWLWFIFLFIVSALNILYRILTITCVKFRIYLLQTQVRNISYEHVKTASSKGQLGDWFLLYQLSRNMNGIAFNKLIKDLESVKRKVNSMSSV